MRNLSLIVFFLASTICASAQKVYFIYLQSDNNSPFYVKMSDKIYSSATSGYLILSNLVDSTYNFSIGFPSSQSESRFAVALGEKDRGFLIKNLDSGLSLFDLQSVNITNAQKDDAPKNISYIRRNDGFSSLLSKAANDTSLLYAVVRVKENDVAIKNEKRKTNEPAPKSDDTISPKDTTSTLPLQSEVALETKKPDSDVIQSNVEAEKKDSGITTAINDGTNKDSIAFEELKNPPNTVDSTATLTIGDSNNTNAKVTSNATEEPEIYKRSKVKKHSESSTSEGFGLVYYDVYDGGRDTIRLLIPNPPVIFKQSTEQDSSLTQQDFIHVDELKKDTVQKPSIVVSPKNNVPVKSQCKTIASNNDFFKLRKNMAAENTDERMVAEAKNFFRSKCFTTEQVKNLSALFLTSAGKYQFFDAAYLHISDQENFPSLASEIKDDYYLKRFKALIGE